MPTSPVLYLDTLKVSTIEQTAETAEARGGKGNPALIMWDYGKEINVTLEDALFSAKSMAIMFGNGKVKEIATGSYIMKTEVFTCTRPVEAITYDETDGGVKDTAALADCGWNDKFEAPDGSRYVKINPKFYDENDVLVTKLEADKKYFCTFDLAAKGSVIEISANSFPGTYYVTGDTFARSQASGKDEFFQFIIPKAKVQSENTITLEADGDPSVFNMSLRVLRPDDGKMMKLVKYELTGDKGAAADENTVDLIHNHKLAKEEVVAAG